MKEWWEIAKAITHNHKLIESFLHSAIIPFFYEWSSFHNQIYLVVEGSEWIKVIITVILANLKAEMNKLEDYWWNWWNVMESMESIIESLEWTAEDELAARHQQHFFSFHSSSSEWAGWRKEVCCGWGCPLRIEKKAIMKWNGIIGWWTMKQRWVSEPFQFNQFL